MGVLTIYMKKIMMALIFVVFSNMALGSLKEIPIGPDQILYLENGHSLSIFLLEQRPLTNQEKLIAREIQQKTKDEGIKFLIGGLIDHDFSDPFEFIYDRRAKSYRSICSSVGKARTGRFTDQNEQTITRTVTVGSNQSGCYGRCGSQCGDGDNTRYTQECLNHDLCHRTLDRQLGPCKDEFWLAAPGFFSAPQCN